MDMPYLNANLDSLDAPNFRKGCNYAAAGSTILPATATSFCPFSFGVQVNQFLHFKARVLELRTGKGGKKLDKYLPADDYFQKGLYMFDIGQNDIAGAFYSKTLDQILASIPAILSEFESGVQVRLNGFFLSYLGLMMILFRCAFTYLILSVLEASFYMIYWWLMMALVLNNHFC